MSKFEQSRWSLTFDQIIDSLLEEGSLSPPETKDTNPKDLVAVTKLDLGLVPDSLVVAAAVAFAEGALKYGRYNWRIAGVRSSVYNAALRRHLSKWWNGENSDPETLVPHLASVIACAGILIDAELADKLTDDRPPTAYLAQQIREAEAVLAHLKALFKDHSPIQYTIYDSTETL